MTAISIIAYAWTRPFVQPMPVWNYWPALLFPLCACVAIVYKAIKCPDMKSVPKEAAGIFLWILGGMAMAAAVLWAIVRVVSR
jgi:hypothetical protein